MSIEYSLFQKHSESDFETDSRYFPMLRSIDGNTDSMRAMFIVLFEYLTSIIRNTYQYVWKLNFWGYHNRGPPVLDPEKFRHPRNFPENVKKYQKMSEFIGGPTGWGDLTILIVPDEWCVILRPQGGVCCCENYCFVVLLSPQPNQQTNKQKNKPTTFQLCTCQS